MAITITLEFASSAEAVAALRAIDSAASYQADDAARTELQAKREVTKTLKQKAEKAVEVKAEAKPEVKPEPVAEAVPEIGYPQVQAAILKVANSKGREAALEVLAKFDAKAGKELKPEQYVAALAAFNEVLEVA